MGIDEDACSVPVGVGTDEDARPLQVEDLERRLRQREGLAGAVRADDEDRRDARVRLRRDADDGLALARV